MPRFYHIKTDGVPVSWLNETVADDGRTLADSSRTVWRIPMTETEWERLQGGISDQPGTYSVIGWYDNTGLPVDSGDMVGNAWGRHDYSFAGYKRSEVELAERTIPPTVYDVTDEGANDTGATDSTTAIQAAIDKAEAGGGVVYVPGGTYRVDGTLTVNASDVVIKGDGSRLTYLHFTKDTGIGDRASDGIDVAHLLVGTAVQTTSAETLLTSDGEKYATTIDVADASAYSVGDDVAVGWDINADFVADHSMTNVWDQHPTYQTWQPVFQREIVGINGNTVMLDVPLRLTAKTRDAASLRKIDGRLTGIGIEGLSISNACDYNSAWAEDSARLIAWQNVADGWLKDVKSYEGPNSPTSGEGAGSHLWSFGVYLDSCKRITVDECEMSYTENRGGSGNGYGFSVRNCSEVLFRDCVAVRTRHGYSTIGDFGDSGIVYLRCVTRNGSSLDGAVDTTPTPSPADAHQRLAMACLVDRCTIDDGWWADDRGLTSGGAGITAVDWVWWRCEQDTPTTEPTPARMLIRYYNRVLACAGISQDVDSRTYVDNGTPRASAPDSLFEHQLNERV